MEMEMKEKIISYMRDEVRRPITAESLAEELGVKAEHLITSSLRPVNQKYPSSSRQALSLV